MKDVLHKTLIGILREHVIAWRKAESWSRETVAQVIIETHYAINTVSGIVFEPQTKDIHEAREINAQRLFRWLDDESKGSGLLPANFIPSILAAMPIERRLACGSEVMVSIGLGACLLSEGEEGDLNINHAFELQREDLESTIAITTAIQNPTEENITAAQLKSAKARKRREWLERRLAGFKRVAAGTKAVLGRLVHPKEPA